MKKIISILLVTLTIFSFATVAFAEGEKATYTAYFVYSTAEGEQVATVENIALGTDLDDVAPAVKSYVHPSDDTVLVKFSHWSCDTYAVGEEIRDLPAFDEKDGDYYDGIRFVAKYEYVENNFKNQTEDKIEDALDSILPEGNPIEGISDWFTTITDLLKKWFSLFVFYIQSFLG